MIRNRGRKSLRETLAENQKALNSWGAAFGKSVPQIAIKPKREIVNRADASELEASVINEVGALLAHHPRVLFAVRQNSGAAYLTGRDGKDVPVWFYKIIRSRLPQRISDYWGLLTNGRMFAIECKRRSWTKPTDKREEEQQAFLETVRGTGGVALFATCSADVEQQLNG